MTGLSVLPARTAGAAENMAIDFLMLQRWPGAPVPRFRHYDWRGPAFTFGYSQKIEFIRTQLPPEDEGIRFDLCRRQTGGGLVDHREDWTYSLVIPRGHALEEARATESYRIIHECIAAALQAQGVKAQLAKTPSASASAGAGSAAPAGVCFQKSEIHDVIAPGGQKIAGAAQKRSKAGLLFQGSIWRPAAGGKVDWDQFEADFPAKVAESLGGAATPCPWPDFNEEEMEGLIEQYSQPEWLEAR